MATVDLQGFIPEAINNFRVFRDGKRLLGIASSLNLPEIEIETEEIAGAGMWGTRSVPATGHVKDLEWTLPFISYGAHMTEFGDTTQEINIHIRAAQQMQNEATLAIAYIPFYFWVRGRMVKFKPGKVELAKRTEAELTMNVDYMKLTLGEESQFEFDKINGTYYVDGKDLLEPIQALIS